MGLRSYMEGVLADTVEDPEGYGWPITVTDPAELAVPMVGLSNDIGQVINVETGLDAGGRSASVALRISSLTAAGLALPQGIEDASSKPWVVEFTDIAGTTQKFKVVESRPDRAIGLVVCLLELYK